MPMIRVELLRGRSPETKEKLAREFTESMERIAGINPEATTIVFVDIDPHDWIIAGNSLAMPKEKADGQE